MNTGETQACRTAAEAGWHVSHYNIKAPTPDSEKTAIYNTYKRSCDEYTPDELSVMSNLDQIAEDDPLIKRLARCGVIANHDERESFELMRKLGSVIAPGGAVCITICPTLACNFECPYCFEDRVAARWRPKSRTTS